MSGEDLKAHLRSGSTTVCRAWKVVRQDGACMGFTDHDLTLTFAGVEFVARSGLSARALHQSTGLSVDNSAAYGALSDASISEEDILAGRYDQAEVTAYLVNWTAPDDHLVIFKGTFGEITRKAGSFEVELRGLAEPLNRLQGRVFQSGCSAFVGDSSCKVDLTLPEYSLTAIVVDVQSAQSIKVEAETDHPDGYFSTGVLDILEGAGAGLRFNISQDARTVGGRAISLWESMTILPAPGDRVRFRVGCDGRARTCREVFRNFENFRGFPHIPGEDWLKRFPSTTGASV